MYVCTVCTHLLVLSPCVRGGGVFVGHRISVSPPDASDAATRGSEAAIMESGQHGNNTGARDREGEPRGLHSMS